MESRGEGFVCSSILVYHSGHGIPCSRVGIRGSSGGHGGNGVLDLSTKAPPELDYYSLWVGISGVGYEVLELVYVLVQGTSLLIIVRGYRISSGPLTPLYVPPHRRRLQISEPSPDLPTT